MPQTCHCGCEDRTSFVIPFYKRCLKFAAKKTSRENAEDFASYAAIKFLESGRHNPKWLFIDYVRRFVGDLRLKNYEERFYLNHPYSLDEMLKMYR